MNYFYFGAALISGLSVRWYMGLSYGKPDWWDFVEDLMAPSIVIYGLTLASGTGTGFTDDPWVGIIAWALILTPFNILPIKPTNGHRVYVADENQTQYTVRGYNKNTGMVNIVRTDEKNKAMRTIHVSKLKKSL
jgi:hypothetical protein